MKSIVHILAKEQNDKTEAEEQKPAEGVKCISASVRPSIINHRIAENTKTVSGRSNRCCSYIGNAHLYRRAYDI